MTNIPYQFILKCSAAETTLASERALRNEVVFPAAACFEALARRLLMLFAEHDSLQAVTLTCLMQPTIEEDNLLHIVKLNQHLKLTTLGKVVLENPGTTLLESLATYIPAQLMGTGSFTVERNSPIVQETLLLFGTDSFGSAELEVTDALSYTLSQRLKSSFKSIFVDVYGGLHL
jgi:hypothetical protein